MDCSTEVVHKPVPTQCFILQGSVRQCVPLFFRIQKDVLTSTSIGVGSYQGSSYVPKAIAGVSPLEE